MAPVSMTISNGTASGAQVPSRSGGLSGADVGRIVGAIVLSIFALLLFWLLWGRRCGTLPPKSSSLSSAHPIPRRGRSSPTASGSRLPLFGSRPPREQKHVAQRQTAAFGAMRYNPSRRAQPTAMLRRGSDASGSSRVGLLVPPEGFLSRPKPAVLPRL